MDAEHPDERRRAIEAVCDSRFVSTDSNVKTMALIVRTDGSLMVRQAAARSLGASGRAEAVDPLTAVLESSTPNELSRPQEGALRRCCLESAGRLCSSGVTIGTPARLVQAATTLLARDPNRDVRIASARLLGHLKSADALQALIDALQQKDFAVTYEAERSLINLTGHTHKRNSKDWRAWLARCDDPFAHAGQTPADLADTMSHRPWWNPFVRKHRDESPGS